MDSRPFRRECWLSPAANKRSIIGYPLKANFPRIRGGFGQIGVGGMTHSANSSQLWPKDLIEQGLGIIMNRFDLDATQALKVLHRMSKNTRTQMYVVAEQIINHNVPVEALCGLKRMYPASA
jgi:hypothetical protein